MCRSPGSGRRRDGTQLMIASTETQEPMRGLYMLSSADSYQKASYRNIRRSRVVASRRAASTSWAHWPEGTDPWTDDAKEKRESHIDAWQEEQDTEGHCGLTDDPTVSARVASPICLVPSSFSSATLRVSKDQTSCAACLITFGHYECVFCTTCGRAFHERCFTADVHRQVVISHPLRGLLRPPDAGGSASPV